MNAKMHPEVDRFFIEATRALGIRAMDVQPSERGMIYNRFHWCDLQITDLPRRMSVAIQNALCADRLKELKERANGR